jgi:hypothetical protein
MGQQLSLSLELICLLEWLIKHGKEELRHVVQSALRDGFNKNLSTMKEEDYLPMVEQLYEIVMSFVLMLEEILGEESNKELVRSVNYERAALPLMERRHPDVKRVWSHDKIMGRAKSVKKDVFKELLEDWTPPGNEPVN